MDECFNCGISEEKVRLFDAVGDEGIVKVCESCSFDESVPVIKKPTTFQLKEAERRPQTYERFSKAAEMRLSEESSVKKADLQKQEMTLRELVDRNFVSKAENSKPREDLIDNFHWALMRARRSKKLSQKQLAEELAESEAAIKMAEDGILPEDDYRLVNKLETFLGIKILKKDVVEEPKRDQPARVLDFKADKLDNITISDLKDMKEKKEEEILVLPPEDIEKEVESQSAENIEKEFGDTVDIIEEGEIDLGEFEELSGEEREKEEESL